MKKLLTAIPLVMLMAGGTAFAQNAEPTEFPTSGMEGAEVTGMFADDDGNMRPFDDFAERYVAATDEQRAEAKTFCERYMQDESVTSPRVASRCSAVADM